MNDFFQVTKKTEEVVSVLTQLSQEEGIEIATLSKIWATLPINDEEEITYLELAGQCVLELSSLVDTTFPDLPRNQRTAKKLKVMGKMLELKAEELV